MRLSGRHIYLTGFLLAAGIMVGCGQNVSIRPPLPPSATDLVLLKSTALCERKPEFLKKRASAAHKTNAWGSGKEMMIPQARSASQADESYFVDEDGLLVGALFTFPKD